MRRLSVLLFDRFFFASCETVKVVGRDIESTGETIGKAID